MRLVMTLLACISFSTIASAEQPSDATANFLSGGAVSALKAASKNSSLTTEQKDCVDHIPASALAPLYKAVIASRLSEADLASLERFYSSPLGVRYVATIHAGADPTDAFSPPELSQLSSSLKAIPQEKLFKATSSQDSEIAEKEMATIKPLVDACLGAV